MSMTAKIKENPRNLYKFRGKFVRLSEIQAEANLEAELAVL